jgi:Ca-activated chloride channel family protein
LLDLRGGEQKIKTNIPDQKTIIVLDNSLSMLCEDIRPSRFSKSIQLARHFVKNAPGHKIAIVLFSDNQKRVLPFTDDIDLIDARLSSLDKTNSVSGGTNISQAITEAVQYFEADSDEDSKEISGNLLVFTDSEEGDENFKLDIPTNINLAVVGVGTLSGGNIPLRWENNSFRGYKTFKGENVITKLDENYIKQMGKNTKNFKYWIVNSYSIPTDEIMNFLRASYSKKLGSGDIRIRPVLSHFILIPAILLYCLSVILGRFPLFKV